MNKKFGLLAALLMASSISASYQFTMKDGIYGALLLVAVFKISSAQEQIESLNGDNDSLAKDQARTKSKFLSEIEALKKNIEHLTSEIHRSKKESQELRNSKDAEIENLKKTVRALRNATEVVS